MKALKNLSLILLLVLTFTGCHDKSSKLADFNRAVYTPEYASGFDIKGADGKRAYWLPSRTLGRELTALPHTCSSPVTEKAYPKISPVRCSEKMPSASSACPLPISPCSTQSVKTGALVGVSGIDYISNPDIQARRDSVGDVGYEGNINYELLLSLDPDLVLLYGVNGAKLDGGQNSKN